MTGTAFVCAMPMEAKPLARRLGLRSEVVGGLPVRSGTLAGAPVYTTVTGMGTRLAATGVERLLDSVRVGRILVVGICGAVGDVTPIGALVRPEMVIDGATGAEHRPEGWGDFGDGAAQGKLWTSDELIVDPGRLSGLRDRGVVALDMETAAVARVCEQRGVPWAVVRAVSDRAGDGSLDPEVFHLSKPDGKPDPPAVVSYVLHRPTRVPGLVRLMRGARLATEAAAAAAIEAARSL